MSGDAQLPPGTVLRASFCAPVTLPNYTNARGRASPAAYHAGDERREEWEGNTDMAAVVVEIGEEDIQVGIDLR